MVTFNNPLRQPWDGMTAHTGVFVCYLGKDSDKHQFRVLAVNCAIWDVLSPGFRVQDCSCVRVMGACTTKTAITLQDRRRAAYFLAFGA